MAPKDRDRYTEFIIGVKGIQLSVFRHLFCRVCPKGKSNLDKNGHPIPLQCHHLTPLSLCPGQTAKDGIILCTHIHQNFIHKPPKGILTESGELLKVLFYRDRKKECYNIGLKCPYK